MFNGSGQLCYGEYFRQNGKFLKENIHSMLLASYHWPNSYVLYQPLLALVYRWGGLGRLGTLGALVLAASLVILGETSQRRLWWRRENEPVPWLEKLIRI